MLKHLTLLVAVLLTAFITGCSESTSIFIKEVNILGADDLDDDISWLEDISIDELPDDIWGECLTDIVNSPDCPVTDHGATTEPSSAADPGSDTTEDITNPDTEGTSDESNDN